MFNTCQGVTQFKKHAGNVVANNKPCVINYIIELIIVTSLQYSLQVMCKIVIIFKGYCVYVFMTLRE